MWLPLLIRKVPGAVIKNIHIEICKTDRTTWKSILQDIIYTTSIEPKRVLGCKLGQLILYFSGSSGLQNNRQNTRENHPLSLLKAPEHWTPTPTESRHTMCLQFIQIRLCNSCPRDQQTWNNSFWININLHVNIAKDARVLRDSVIHTTESVCQKVSRNGFLLYMNLFSVL